METSVFSTQTKSVSSLWFIWQMTRDPLEALTQLAQENGDIGYVRVRKQDIFLFNHPSLIEQVLVKQSEKFIKGHALQRAKVILGEGLLTSEGKEHLDQRRALQPAMQRNRIEEYMPLMVGSTQKHMSAWKNKQQLDMAEEMMRLTLDITLWSFFGSAPQGASEVVGRAMKTLVKLFPLALFPLPEKVRALFSSFQQAQHDLTYITEMLINNPSSLTAQHALINILKKSADANFTEEQIRSHVLTFLLAGHETTALMLAWALDMIAHHPDVQGKLQAEADAVFENGFTSREDMEKLSYTRAVIKETLRLRPPAWAMGRQAIEDVEIGGHLIPTGSTVILSPWVTQRDARYYLKPEDFVPERWNQQFLMGLPKFAWFPFGGGSRVCIGEHFAMMEATIALAMIAHQWKINPVYMPTTPQPSVTLRPRHGVVVTVENRS